MVASHGGLMNMGMCIHAYGKYAQVWAYRCMDVWSRSFGILIHMQRVPFVRMARVQASLSQ